MTVSEIINNAFDLAGGSLVKNKLDQHTGVLACLNILREMQMEVANSGKLNSSFVYETTLGAGLETGEIDIHTPFTTDKKIILYKSSNNLNTYELLSQVTSFADVASSKNAGRRVIHLTGTGRSLKYYLSFAPPEPLSVQIWLKSSWSDIAAMDDDSNLPSDMDLVAVYRLAGYFLNQLLLPETGGKEYFAFVQSQTALMQQNARRVEHIWRVYLHAPPDSGSVRQVRPYEIEDELGETFDLGINGVIW